MTNSLTQLFEPNPNRQPSFLSNKWTQISSALFGFGFVCFYNFFTKRPVLSGMYMTVSSGLCNPVPDTRFQASRSI